MSLDKNYFEYPLRQYGMDHQHYNWSMLNDRKKVSWPNGRSIALWINVGMQFYPLNQKGNPFKVPGGMTMPYPDLRHFSLRDYGNRVGIYRLLRILDKYQVKSTFAFNSRLAERVPQLLKTIVERDDEIMCHGLHMDALHYGGMDKQVEQINIRSAVSKLSELSGKKITGWISPAKNESENTPELLAKNGIEYFCDWVNDEMPYQFDTKSNSLIAMPLSTELSDQFILMNNLHSEQSYLEQVTDQFDYLLQESEQQGGRIISLQIHPWLLGQPHRIKYFDAVLNHITNHSQVWSATANEIKIEWQSQQLNNQ